MARKKIKKIKEEGEELANDWRNAGVGKEIRKRREGAEIIY